MSVLVEQNPGRECEDDHQRRIDERRRTNVRFQFANLNDPVRDEGQSKAAQDTDHPGRKIGTENIKAAIRRSNSTSTTGRVERLRTRGGLLPSLGATRTNSAFIFVVA